MKTTPYPIVDPDMSMAALKSEAVQKALHTMQHKGLQPAGQAHLQVEHGANPHLGLRMPFKGTLIAPDLAVEIPC